MAGNAGDANHPLGSGPIDAYGNIVPSTQAEYVGLIQNFSGAKHLVYFTNPNYKSSSGSGSSSPAGVSPQYQFTFDTIGQTIYRTIGHCRLPLRIIWAQGIQESGDIVNSATVSFAAALCAPIDPQEEGTVSAVFAAGIAVFDDGGGGVIIPVGLDATTAALLTASLNSAIVYPGDEAQEPAPLIQADKGVAETNAFRGIRYIIFPNWPLAVGQPTSMSVQFTRTNDISGSFTPAAVEFAAGTG